MNLDDVLPKVESLVADLATLATAIEAIYARLHTHAQPQHQIAADVETIHTAIGQVVTQAQDLHATVSAAAAADAPADPPAKTKAARKKR